MTEFLAGLFSPIQLIGYVGMACAAISYQCKRNRNYFIFQAACGMAFALQFLLLGGWSGAFLNILSIARGLILGGGARWHKRRLLLLLEGGFFVSLLLSVLVFSEPWWVAVLLFIAQAGGTLVMWTQDGKKIRVAQLSFISPIWLLHNSVYKLSLGGILTETFNMISVIVSFIRFRKSGFEKG